MKFLNIVLPIIIFSFPFSPVSAQKEKIYEAEWKRVDALIKQRGLAKSALEETMRIYEMAKRDKQDAQVIKALVYITNLQQENRLDNLKTSIKELEKEINSSKEPATSLLKSLTAGMYWQYFQNQRWQLYNRTNTIAFTKDDIATWTIEDFHARISALYIGSLKNEKLLQQTSLAPFDAIITKGNVRYLRPTLYDLLAHQAIGYFINSERDIKKPAYAFQLDDPNIFAPASAFINVKFETRDSLSLQHKALLLFQKLIAFHLNDDRSDALADVDIQRIQFVHQNATIENKDELYTAALAAITKQYPNVPAAAQASYLLALHYHQLASRYQPYGDTTYRLERIKARDILLKVVRDSATKSEGWVNSFNLLNEIQKEEFSFEIEKISVPGKPFRTLVRYRNIPAIHFRLITATAEIKAQLRNNPNSKVWAALSAASPIRSWQQKLPEPGDLQNHSVEVKVDALPVGEYLLIASNEAAFNGLKSTLSAQLFAVSNISYINQGTSFFVLHRETGQPLPNAAVELFVQEYNYNTSRYVQTKQGDFKTNKNGYFSIPTAKGRERGYLLNISHEKDKLFLQDVLYNHFNNGDQRNEKQVTHTFLFNDRSIYRPGQTVYFKGIVISRSKEQNNVAPNHSTTVYLRNANWENIDSLKFTTNDFGSYNGSFILPQNMLNGIFYLENSQGENIGNFSVEEYKRPRFKATIDKVKETYKVGDTITVTGSAAAYAGNKIDQATVVYRVVRQPRFQYPWIRGKGWPGFGEPMEISHGTVTTAADGSFTFRFVAIPDRKIDARFDPVFDYRVHVDITDAGGETRSADNIISAGYKSLLLQLNVPERISMDSLQKLLIRTENMNGVFQSAPVTISFYHLLPEQRLVRKRYWEQPDQFVMTKEEFLQHFPIDEYLSESDFKTWTREKLIFSITDTTSSNSLFSLAGARIQAGFYALEVTTKDKDGSEVKDIRYVEVYNESVKQLSRPEYLWTRGSKSIEPGEKTSVMVGSSAPNVFLIQQEDHTKGPVYTRYEIDGKPAPAFQFTNLTNEKKLFSFEAAEKDRGGYGVSFFFIKDNRLYQFNDIIQVPWTNKELQIEYATFRDKILPGSEEKWKVRITGYKKEKVAAEMLASMYDASLDAFRLHQWNKPNIWPVYSRGMVWQGMQNFSSVQSMLRHSGRETFRSFEKRYDRFIFDQMGDGYGGDLTTRRMMSVQTAAPTVAREEAMTESKAVVGNATTQTFDIQEESYDKKFTPVQELKSPGVQASEPPNLQIRKNFAETAFFFPELRTDKDGNIEFEFTAPEALTRWKLQTIAHTKDASMGIAIKEIVTQKELMVQPNMPRFLRQGDHIELSSKIANLSAGDLNGSAVLQLFDAVTNLPADAAFGNTSPVQNFKTATGASTVFKYDVKVPTDFTSILTWRIVATAGNWSDGEEMTLPVLSNRMLVTETMPLPMRGTGTKTFTFDKLINAGNSNTLKHHALTVEYTANPAWYAVQALPYLIEQPTESAEQIWNRYYAASLATKIVSAAPRIRQIFEKWKTADTAALLSNLQKNQELKSALLEETPWVLQAKTETQQKKNIALLFDLVRMQSEMTAALQKLKNMQSANGGFVWVKGAPEDRYMTQYIVTGIGHLMKLGAISAGQQEQMNTILRTALPYLDRKIKDDYDNLLKRKANMEQQVPDPIQIQYLYMRSFFSGRPVATARQAAYNFYRTRAHRTWTKQNKFSQGMIALALHRSKDLQTPVDILRSLKETAIISEELGMYWQDQRFGFSWNWWYAPIETQALLIEAFTEIGNDTKTVDDMRTWLIKHKQTNNWRTGKATAGAVYAFLLQGTEWLTNEPAVQIKLGAITINAADNKKEAGTGYFKQTFDAEIVKPSMGNISLTVQQPSAGGTTFNAPSWGAVYWQYFENMDKITTASTPLQLSKKLFIEKNTDRGPMLTPITEGSTVSVGDKIKVRVEVKVDRDMEYVQMKDLRASAFEPVNVMSGYKWQGGLGYYETTKDVSTSFYFHQLRRGTYVFEYPLFVTHSGNFSNGITTIQSFYAPEFSAHSEGVRVIVK